MQLPFFVRTAWVLSYYERKHCVKPMDPDAAQKVIISLLLEKNEEILSIFPP